MYTPEMVHTLYSFTIFAKLRSPDHVKKIGGVNNKFQGQH